MLKFETKRSPEETVLETLSRLADETGNVEIYEKQLSGQIGEEAKDWDLRLIMTNLKTSGAFMGRPYFRSSHTRGLYFSVILRSKARFPTPDRSNLRYD